MSLRATKLLDARESPWADSAEYNPVSVGGCPTSIVAATDVKRVVAHDGGGDDFDEGQVAIVELHDGRFVGWESSRDATGSGFHHDAYGGGVDVWFARSAEDLRPLFSERARDALGL